MTQPLVTLGMPVRNGAATLRSALDSMVNQDYSNLEIVISDNASDDSTADILHDYARRYRFIRLFRHEVPISAYENYTFVLRQAGGQFFAWCAHDDTRSLNFISGLLPFLADPATILAFGDLYIFDGKNPPSQRTDYQFATDDLPRWRRLRKTALIQCFHIYGLWRIEALKNLKLSYGKWWPDMPIMLGMAAIGTFHYVPGVSFYYFEVTKTARERAYYQDYRAPMSLIGNLMDVFKASFVTVSRTSDILSGILAVIFLAEKFARQVPKSLARRFELASSRAR